LFLMVPGGKPSSLSRLPTLLSFLTFLGMATTTFSHSQYFHIQLYYTTDL
jgi:hypothetical protein